MTIHCKPSINDIHVQEKYIALWYIDITISKINCPIYDYLIQNI